MSGYPARWIPEQDADLIHRRQVLRQVWADIAFIMQKSRRGVTDRYHMLVGPKRKGRPKIALLHRELGIETHVVRVPILNDQVGQWDELEHVWSFHHRFRESVTLAGAAA